MRLGRSCTRQRLARPHRLRLCPPGGHDLSAAAAAFRARRPAASASARATDHRVRKAARASQRPSTTARVPGEVGPVRGRTRPHRRNSWSAEHAALQHRKCGVDHWPHAPFFEEAQAASGEADTFLDLVVENTTEYHPAWGGLQEEQQDSRRLRDDQPDVVHHRVQDDVLLPRDGDAGARQRPRRVQLPVRRLRPGPEPRRRRRGRQQHRGAHAEEQRVRQLPVPGQRADAELGPVREQQPLRPQDRLPQHGRAATPAAPRSSAATSAASPRTRGRRSAGSRTAAAARARARPSSTASATTFTRTTRAPRSPRSTTAAASAPRRRRCAAMAATTPSTPTCTTLRSPRRRVIDSDGEARVHDEQGADGAVARCASRSRTRTRWR